MHRLLLIALLAAGCSSEPTHPGSIGGGTPPTGRSSACKSGDTRPCDYIDDSILNDAAAAGFSTCIDGTWVSCSPLEDGGSNEAG